MLHVPTNIRYVPSPMLSPAVEQKDFIPKDDTSPIVVESNEEVVQEIAVLETSLVGSPNLQSNILTHSINSPQVCDCENI